MDIPWLELKTVSHRLVFQVGLLFKLKAVLPAE